MGINRDSDSVDRDLLIAESNKHENEVVLTQNYSNVSDVIDNRTVSANRSFPSESTPQTSKRGGKRPGAGTKPNLAKVLLKGVSRNTILAAGENVDVA
jgi:hypothetical protein